MAVGVSYDNVASGLAATDVQAALDELVASALPVASFERISKIALTAVFDGGASSGTQDGNALTYAWSASGGPGVAIFDSPSAAVTSVAYTEPGQYTITLTVTDAAGHVATQTQTQSVARVIEVASPDEATNDYMPTVTAALAWIAGAADGHVYEVVVRGATVEPGPIANADLVHIHYQGGANSTFVGVGYSWTVSPANVILSGETGDPYRPAVQTSGAGSAFIVDTIDAANLHVRNIAFFSSGLAGAVRSVRTDNLKLVDVGARTSGSEVYVTYHSGPQNLQLVGCVVVGDGVAFGIGAIFGRTNTAVLVDCYGELSATPADSASGVLYLPGPNAGGIGQDILVANCSFINNASGNAGLPLGYPRSVVVNGVSAGGNPTGTRLVGNVLVQRVAANPTVYSGSAMVERNSLHMVGNAMSGGLGWVNCAADPAATVTATNAFLS